MGVGFDSVAPTAFSHVSKLAPVTLIPRVRVRLRAMLKELPNSMRLVTLLAGEAKPIVKSYTVLNPGVNRNEPAVPIVVLATMITVRAAFAVNVPVPPTVFVILRVP